MADTEIPPVLLDEFRARATAEGSVIQVTMSGTADASTKAALDGLFLNVHNAALAANARLVQVDIRTLEFMNSSSLKAFLTWLRTIREGNAAYKVEIRTSPAMYWQRRSVAALVAFAPEHLKHIDG